MKYHRYLSIPAFLLVISLIFVSCQDSPEVFTSGEKEDPFMAEALELVEQELQSIEANIPEASRSSYKSPTYTVICYKYEMKGNETEGKLTYSTWNDDIQGYIEVTEEEITAFVTPGTWIFQCRGGGMKSLNGIEFDAPSRSVIGDGNYELIPNKLWLTVIPDNANDVELKYDILYDAKKDDQGVIRLDPKIKVDDNTE